MKNKLASVALVLNTLFLLAGCDPITRHKALSTVFDGVPSLPAPEQMCTEYADKRVAAYKEELAGKAVSAQKSAAATASVHPPYEEKKCDNCHDKGKEGGFVTPLHELCYKCHDGFIKGSNVHGPIAVADCLACHVPHDSQQPSLLKESKGQLCLTCHREARIAAVLHTNAARHELVCTDCHDPHYGEMQYFIK
jgi:predicted CXXCH cytochrome family protein